MSLPDVQSTAPDVRISLTRVGVKNVKKLVEVGRPGKTRPAIFISDFDVFVDLPSSLKGANLSRNFEVIVSSHENCSIITSMQTEPKCSCAVSI